MTNNKNNSKPIVGLDAVKMQRETPEKFSEKYWENPGILKKEMEENREKYHFKEIVTQ